MTANDVRSMLAAACGPQRVAAGAATDAIGGLIPAHVARPADTASVSAVLDVAAQLGLAVLPRGAGTKLDWTNPPSRLDMVIDLSTLNGVIEHAPGDLIVRAHAGTPLAQLQAELAPSHQCLAVDEVVPGSTIGGVIATALSGPRRMLYGAVRDLLIGVTVVRADGVVAHAGGRVVKNVAGYDLCKLYTGSYGTLGVITEAIFRLHPVAESRGYMHARYPDLATASGPLRAAIGSDVAPAAIELRQIIPAGPVDVSVLIEGSRAGVAARLNRMARLLGAATRLETSPPEGWGLMPGPTTIRMTAELDAVTDVLGAVNAAARAAGVRAEAVGSAGSGVLHLGLPWDVPVIAASAVLDAARGACTNGGGFAQLLRARPDVRSAVDAWGPVPGIGLMHRIKANFDPDGVFSPGRYVGGI